ncbi:MAG: FimB/Mfa2 family fimbrial subunit [Lachnospiraceae bacterium]|nr:FimB/Mfa2 family fimbrial subunit [Lachnospiraceae bacterium]
MNIIRNIIGTLVLAMIIGCTGHEIEDTRDSEVIIKLSVASELTSRAGAPRTLESADNWQRVTDMMIFVFRSDTEDGEYKLLHPTIRQTDGTDKKVESIRVDAFDKTEIYKNSEFETHTTTVIPRLKKGYYRFLALGVDNLSFWKENTINFEEGVTEWDDAVLKFDTVTLNEFFSGYPKDNNGKVENIYISGEREKTLISIELKRCVAGVLLYVKNIPTTYNNKNITNIRLVLSGNDNSTSLIERSWLQDSEPTATETILADFTAESCNETIGEGTDKEEQRYYTGAFLLPSRTSMLENSVMRMDFMSNDAVIKSLKVVTTTSSEDENSQTIGNGSKLEVNHEGTLYNIVANHIYCIGLRYENGEKIPIDLGEAIKDNSIRIIALGSWQADVDIEI